MTLRLDDDNTVRGRIKGKKNKPVCGDHVTAEPIENEPEWLITGIAERRNALTRPNLRGQAETLAANIDFLCVVAAARPDPDWFVVDRYLCAAELMDVPAAVVFNKTDLLEDLQATEDMLDTYRDLDYATLTVSAEAGTGVADLARLLDGKLSIIVGQSGVGKSTIINSLVDDAELRTGAISDSTGEGKHTTVNSQMLPLSSGGAVIDSPGVRDYAPAIDDVATIAGCFREVREHAQDCRFANCQHLKEPGCAVKDAVENGAIRARRYESYKRLRVLTEQLDKKRR